MKCKARKFELLMPDEGPGDAGPQGRGARLASVFCLPQALWPVLPPGAFYLLSTNDPRRGGFKYMQHTEFPQARVRVPS